MYKLQKKLTAGRIELYERQALEAIAKDQSYKIQFGTDVMVLSPKDIKDKCVYKPTLKDGSVLWCYNWVPDEIDY
jgi:hypothetical protein